MFIPTSKEFKPTFAKVGMYPDYVRNKKNPAKSDDPAKAVRGLYLLVQSATSKSWILRYTLGTKIDKATGQPRLRLVKKTGELVTIPRTREMGLGRYPDIGLAKARELARAARALHAEGVDPIATRDEARAEAKLEEAKRITFAAAAKQYLDAHRAEWRSAEHAEQWERSVSKYALPIIGDLPVEKIDRGLVLRVLTPIWKTKMETASRLRGRIETVLGWARANGYRDGDNPAAWDHLRFDLAAREKAKRVVHHPAMPYRDLPAFMAELRNLTGVAARALEFTILTAARSGETFGAKWGEIDLEALTWTVPANRIKAGREHRVPLCDRAITILTELQPAIMADDTLVFPGRGGRPLSNAAMLRVLDDMGRDFSVHGFRATFKSWATAQTDFKTEAVELALAHTQPDKVEQAYQRSDMFERRRELASAWCQYCGAGQT